MSTAAEILLSIAAARLRIDNARARVDVFVITPLMAVLMWRLHLLDAYLPLRLTYTAKE